MLNLKQLRFTSKTDVYHVKGRPLSWVFDRVMLIKQPILECGSIDRRLAHAQD
jgi:hypothetical protein